MCGLSPSGSGVRSPQPNLIPASLDWRSGGNAVKSYASVWEFVRVRVCVRIHACARRESVPGMGYGEASSIVRSWSSTRRRSRQGDNSLQFSKVRPIPSSPPGLTVLHSSPFSFTPLHTFRLAIRPTPAELSFLSFRSFPPPHVPSSPAAQAPARWLPINPAIPSCARCGPFLQVYGALPSSHPGAPYPGIVRAYIGR